MKIIKKVGLLLLIACITSIGYCQMVDSDYSLSEKEKHVYSLQEKLTPIYDGMVVGATFFIPQENGCSLHYISSFTATTALIQLMKYNTNLKPMQRIIIADMIVTSLGLIKEQYMDDFFDINDIKYNTFGIATANLRVVLTF